MQVTSKTNPETLRADQSSRAEFSHAFGRLLKRAMRPTPALESLAAVTIIRMAKGASAARQKRGIIRLFRGIPAHRNHVVLDVSALDDHDMGLPQLISDVLAEARRCRLNVVIGEVSVRQELLLEMTRISQIVQCFDHNSEAIRACLQVRSPPTGRFPASQVSQ